MASAQSLVSDKLNEDIKNKASGDSGSCFLCKRDNSSGDISENPVDTWLSMDAEDRDKHLKHMKNCILTPFLFGKRMNYSSKNIIWLKRLRLIPTTRRSCSARSCLSDRFIGVADLVEEIVDTVLSCLVSEEFLHNSYHTYKELTECRFVEEALLIGQRSEFVSLMGYCFNGSHCLDHKRIQLLSLTVLHQAMKHICQTVKRGDCLTKYEEAVKRREPACIELRLKGNDHFAVGEYQMAVACYSQAIKFSPFDPLLYGNRAQSYLKLKKLREALSDAKRAVYLKPEWEKGHYRFAQAYFELGFPEKAMAVNSFAQKCCSSTLNLLCQAVVFKREMEESANTNKVNCCGSREGQTVSNCRDQQHEACCENPGPSKTKVGSKRNWNVANQTDTLDPAFKCAVKKDTDKHMPPSVGEDDNCNPCCDKDEDSDIELSDDDFISRLKNYSSDNSDDDSIPPLIFDSSDDSDDDDDDDDDDDNDDDYSSWPDNSDLSDLPRLASCDESDTESDSEFDVDLSDDDDDDDDSYCSDVDCSVCNCCHHGNVDADNGDHVHTDSDTDDDGDSDGSGDNLDILRSLIFPSILNNEINPFLVFDVIRAFLTAHPEMVNEGSPPALPEVIESLPKAKVTKEQVAVTASCAICRCDYEEDETVLVLPCSHLFHPPCITTWLKMHATCPTCRDVLPH